uniref:Uncharacterized protein n=1 Tax=Megaviridae environmental sample TaxID=1737588 RepID=A0A5J6VN96_9VIRU|nr:MAG: hypothetical protein [Megaviridae environmental sample]
MPSPRRTRSQTRSQTQRTINSLTRKLRNMSPSKKKKLTSFIRSIKTKRHKSKSVTKHSKPKRQTRSHILSQLIKLPTRAVNKILSDAKGMEDLEKELIREEKTLKRKQKKQKSLLKYTEKEIRKLETRDISPHVLRNLTDDRIRELLRSEKRDKHEITDELHEIEHRLNRIDRDLSKLKTKR